MTPTTMYPSRGPQPSAGLLDWLDIELAEDPAFGSGRERVHAALARHAADARRPLPERPERPERRESDPAVMLALALVTLAVYAAAGLTIAALLLR